MSEIHPAEMIVQENYKESAFAQMLERIIFPEVKYKNSRETASRDAIIFVMDAYCSQIEDDRRIHKENYLKLKQVKAADEVFEMLDYDDMIQTMKDISLGYKAIFRVLIPLARYASDEEIGVIIQQLVEWEIFIKTTTVQKKIAALLKTGLLLNGNVSAMMFFYERGKFRDYAEAQEKTEDELLFRIYKTGGMKSKKNDEIKDIWLDHYLNNDEVPAEIWKEIYLEDELFKKRASTVVWQQDGKSFIVCEDRLVDSNKNQYELTASPVFIAHPEMLNDSEIEAWEKYFEDNQITQPFDQIKEPIYLPEQINTERFSDCVVPQRSLMYKDRDGFNVEYSTKIGNAVLKVKDCFLDYGYEWKKEACFKFGKLEFKNFTRYVNHIVYILDKETLFERAKKDDASIAPMIDLMNEEEIDKLLKYASEHQCVNISTLLLDWKHKHETITNALDEFSL